MKWLVVTKEEFRRDWNKIEKFRCVSIDEFHYFSNMKSQMCKALLKYIKKHNPEYIYGLTATAYLSSAWQIFTEAKILGHNWNYLKFKYEFFQDVRMGNRIISVQKKGIEKKLAKLVNTIGTTVALQDAISVPEQIYQTEYFELSSEQKRAIVEVQKTETNHIVKWTKTHQINGGTLKGDGYTKTQVFKCEKLNRLKDLCKEHKKVVVVCRYNAEVEMIAKSIPQELRVRRITGEIKNRHEVVKEANESDQMILVINAACSEGYEIPTFDLMVFYSYDFSLKNYIQMKGRIQRINHVKKNVYLSLINKDTIDSDVKNSLDKKVSFDLEIYKK
jgi:predicted helicase